MCNSSKSLWTVPNIPGLNSPFDSAGFRTPARQIPLSTEPPAAERHSTQSPNTMSLVDNLGELPGSLPIPAESLSNLINIYFHQICSWIELLGDSSQFSTVNGHLVSKYQVLECAVGAVASRLLEGMTKFSIRNSQELFNRSQKLIRHQSGHENNSAALMAMSLLCVYSSMTLGMENVRTQLKEFASAFQRYDGPNYRLKSTCLMLFARLGTKLCV